MHSLHWRKKTERYSGSGYYTALVERFPVSSLSIIYKRLLRFSFVIFSVHASSQQPLLYRRYTALRTSARTFSSEQRSGLSTINSEQLHPPPHNGACMYEPYFEPLYETISYGF